MRRPMQRVLAAIISFSVLFSQAMASSILVRGDRTIEKSQFKTCDDLLSRLQNGGLESYLVQSTQSEEAALSLLNDYGAIIGPDATKAILVTAEQLGYDWFGKGVSTRSKAAKTAVSLSKLTDNKWQIFAKTYLENVKQISTAAATKNDYVNRVIHLQMSRLVDALNNESDGLPFFAAVIKRATMLAVLSQAERFTNSESSWIENDRQDRRTFLGLFIGGAAALGTFIHRYWSPYLTFTDFALGAVVFGLGAAAGGRLATMDNLFKKRNIKIIDLEIKKCLESDLCNYLEAGDLRDSDDRQASSRRAKIDRALSLSSGWAEYIETMSPTQLAYLGQVDLLKVEADALVIEQTLNGFDVNGEWIKQLEKSAQAIINSPTSFVKAAEFLEALQGYTEAISKGQKDLASLIAALEKRVDTMKASFDNLKSAPFELPARKADEKRHKDLIDKGDLLLNVIQLELNSIERAKVERKGLAESMAVVNESLPELQNIVRRRGQIRSTQEVRQHAETTLLLIERMRSLQLAPAASLPQAGGAQ